MAKIGRFRKIFSKIRLEHFFSSAKMQLCAKFQKNLMRGSPDIASRTNERTSANPQVLRLMPRDQKGQIWTKKGPKWAGLDFSRTANINFPKENHKISFYTKNQQNSMNRLEDMSQNVDFGPNKCAQQWSSATA